MFSTGRNRIPGVGDQGRGSPYGPCKGRSSAHLAYSQKPLRCSRILGLCEFLSTLHTKLLQNRSPPPWPNQKGNPLEMGGSSTDSLYNPPRCLCIIPHPSPLGPWSPYLFGSRCFWVCHRGSPTPTRWSWPMAPRRIPILIHATSRKELRDSWPRDACREHDRRPLYFSFILSYLIYRIHRIIS